MPKRISIYVLLAVTLGVVFSHFSVQQQENGPLLIVDGRPVDVLGMAQDRWVKLHRSCDGVQPLQVDSPAYAGLHQLIRAYSPPASESAQIVQALTTGKWSLLEVQFKTLLPAVVLVDQTGEVPRIIPNAVWSGQTHPWRPAPFVRQYISNKAPQAPSDLLDCFEPQLKNS